MATLEDWVAIATIVSGGGVAIFAVYLGYLYQLRVFRRDRLIELGSGALNHSQQMLAFAVCLVTTRRVRAALSKIKSTASASELYGLRSDLFVAIAHTGRQGSHLARTEFFPTKDYTTLEVGTATAETWAKLIQEMADESANVLQDAAAISLVGPYEAISAEMERFVSELSTEALTSTDERQLRDTFTTRLTEVRRSIANVLG
jgi:hypothetical protein